MNNPAAALRWSHRLTLDLPFPSLAESQGEKKTITHVDWTEYKAYCEREQEKGEIWDVKWDLPVPGMLEKIESMLRVYPGRDMAYVVAIAFVIGSAVFTVGAFFQLLPLVNPATAFPGIALAIPISTAIGAVFFTIGSLFALAAAVNADRGSLEHVDDGGWNKQYRPALIGGRNWVWIPSAADAEAVFKTLPFQLALMQLFGGMILCITVAPGFPGVLDPTDLSMAQLLVFTPLIVGPSLFLLASAILMFAVQDAWYRPKIGAANWQGAFWNAMGSLGFLLTGVTLFMNDIPGSTNANFFGSVAFLVGSVIQWYDLMTFY